MLRLRRGRGDRAAAVIADARRTAHGRKARGSSGPAGTPFVRTSDEEGGTGASNQS